MTPAEVLRKAAEYLETHGWMQGDYGVPGGPSCLLGAMRKTTRATTPDYDIAYWAIRKSVGGRLPVEWNDQPGRTAEEVIAKLREVADQLDAKDP